MEKYYIKGYWTDRLIDRFYYISIFILILNLESNLELFFSESKSIYNKLLSYWDMNIWITHFVLSFFHRNMLFVFFVMSFLDSNSDRIEYSVSLLGEIHNIIYISFETSRQTVVDFDLGSENIVSYNLIRDLTNHNIFVLK